MKVISNWFPASMHGRVLGLASLSYGVGDVLARTVLGLFLVRFAPVSNLPEAAGSAWRSIFQISIVIALLMIIPALKWLKSQPSQALLDDTEDYHKEYKDSSASVDKNTQLSGFQLTIRRLLRLPKFWTLLVLAPCLALMRETFISWTAVYFSDVLNLSTSDAAMMSMFFPLFGTFSTLLGGWLIDWVSPARRGLVPVLFIFSLTVCLGVGSALTTIHEVLGVSSAWATSTAVLLLSCMAFSLLAPFSFVDGIFVLSLAGKSGAGVAVGILSSFGYTGAILAGHSMGSIADRQGWGMVLLTLTGGKLMIQISMFTFQLNQYSFYTSQLSCFGHVVPLLVA